MTITLNHTIVPSRDKAAAARNFAQLFGLPFERAEGHFAPVRVNDTLTLLFDEDEGFESHHLAFTSATPNSTPFSRASKRPALPMAARPGVSMTASSTIGTAAAACISRTRMATSWN
jgi:hypothetical protein